MLLNSCRKAVRVLVFAAAAACTTAQAASPVAAEPPAQPTPPDPNALKLDTTIQGVKDEVLSFNSEAQSTEQDALYPDYSRVTVFVGVRISSLLLKEIRGSLEGEAPQKISFEKNESIALLLSRNNLVRVLRTNLKPGSHRLHAEFSAQYADDRPGTAPMTGSYDAIFDKSYGATDLELDIGRGTRISKPGLSFRQWEHQK